MHSVNLEPTKEILIGTRTTHQATGDAIIYIMSRLCNAKAMYHCSIPQFNYYGAP